MTLLHQRLRKQEHLQELQAQAQWRKDVRARASRIVENRYFSWMVDLFIILSGVLVVVQATQVR